MFFKKLFITLSVLLVLLFITSLAKAENSQNIYFFYGLGCPHCQIVENYFQENDLYSKYSIEKKEIYFNRENAVLYNKILDQLNYSQSNRGVPTVVIGDKVIVGDKPIIDNFIIEADKDLKASAGTSKEESKPKNLNLTIFAVVGASIVDAINPCAFAVLIILMSTILVIGNSKRALLAGIAFSSSIFISYFLMGLGLYKAFGIGGFSTELFKFLGWIAIILGLLNLKDYFWYGKGFLMEVPISWRPKMKALLKSVTSPIGAFFVGFLVSLFLLPCTSGPYIVILGMLAEKVNQAKAIGYLFLYNIIFILPMLLITFAVYKGFDPNKAEEIRQKRLKVLHLIAGIILIAMGIIILLGWI